LTVIKQRGERKRKCLNGEKKSSSGFLDIRARVKKKKRRGKKESGLVGGMFEACGGGGSFNKETSATKMFQKEGPNWGGSDPSSNEGDRDSKPPRDFFWQSLLGLCLKR